MDIDKIHNDGESIKKMLDDAGYYKTPEDYNPDLEDNNITFSNAYPIKAFEKFLGYYDSDNRIAYNPSISMHTDFSFCLTACRYRKIGSKDTVVLDGVSNEKYDKKARFALNYFKREYNINGFFDFYIKRYRNYGNAKGLSESSAVAASASRALIANVFGSDASEDNVFVSRYARLVSGSGTRAAQNGISIWLSYPKMELKDCAAFNLGKNNTKLYYGIFPKYSDIPTDNAHKIAVNSLFYEKWVNEKYINIKKLILNNFDVNDMLKIAENDMLRLNSVLFSGGLVIQTPESIRLLHEILKFKAKNDGLYFTADTGPSIMILSFDHSLIKEFTENVDDSYLNGSYNFNGYKQKMNDFTKEANEYFIKIN
ncbi:MULTISPECIES: mevalonate 3,5-bisphosphate decarboxylase [Acidiplasma]|uniref:Mevalonate pyrophosphate decarboxylase n=2 Tax=Acidiplasma TaxID=507753 RepID=A0A0Q0RIJ2_9ARCH|nr:MULTISPECIES: mevalonate 3,5-bisphosphate decarboxylase [Acidiplasma]KJE49577.1 mevalonate pyrophosphate decarboxylase [Acidiplasma sp. MBA-1]KPV46818.1 mevalonate pyrophosphate decarboxylase [Acidiplasma aeolicum]KQB35246.1 mevalonate pyrophosphate decarboxylase [Acidiplasma cupricumulans]WMT55877.1 MAG: mevalonate 3,5-bisphosphate decarboxylase [Acidiplasma sp.]